MPITNDDELKEVAAQVSIYLCEIQEYCGRDYNKNAVIKFPRGFIRTATDLRRKLKVVSDYELRTNLAYTIMVSDIISWLLTLTDINNKAKEMLIKQQVFIGGSVIESILQNYLKSVCGKRGATNIELGAWSNSRSYMKT